VVGEEEEEEDDEMMMEFLHTVHFSVLRQYLLYGPEYLLVT
jgi:hypothetical protein